MKNQQISIEFQEFASIEELNAEDRELAQAAGANQENAAFPSGLCAERTAMFAAGAKYPDKDMLSIALAGGVYGHITDEPATPCGACRQVMAQYQAKSGKPMSVIMVGGKKVWKFEKVDDILPLIFDSI